jgi:hypothetical protein
MKNRYSQAKSEYNEESPFKDDQTMDNFEGDKSLLNNNFDRRRNTGNKIPQTVKNSPDKFGFDNVLNLSDIETVPKISKFESAG